MDVYILDALFRKIDVVDEFESIVWAERYSRMGDFELVTQDTSANRKRFVPDTRVSIPQSKRVMLVQTVEQTHDLDKGAVLKVKGRELLSILEKRLAVRVDAEDGRIWPSWTLTGYTPKQLINIMFQSVCINGNVSLDDVIPYIQTGSLYPPDTIPEPFPGGIEWQQKPDTLYKAFTDISDAYDLGFRMYHNSSSTALYFEAYTGSDRTTAQTDLTPVIFSSEMQNLQNTTNYYDNTAEHNVVIVIYHHKDEFDNDTTTSVSVSDSELAYSSGGFERKVTMLEVTSVPEDVPVEPYLLQLGQQELTKGRPLNIYDGEITQHSNGYVYEQHYFLGDLVEVRGDDGGAAYMRVDEQIIKQDGDGFASYPSLTTKTSINPGTWRSWKYDVGWVDMGSSEYWDNQ